MESLTKKIVEKYGERFLKQSAIRLRDGDSRILSLIGGKHYKTIIEIGTYRGISTAFLSEYCDRIVTIDICALPEEIREWREQLWDDLEIKNIVTHNIFQDEEKRGIIEKEEFDLAFVDGGHSVDSVRRDFEFVRHCGKVLFHDYGHIGPDGGERQGNDVKKFIDSLTQGKFTSNDIFMLWEKN